MSYVDSVMSKANATMSYRETGRHDDPRYVSFTGCWNVVDAGKIPAIGIHHVLVFDLISPTEIVLPGSPCLISPAETI